MRDYNTLNESADSFKTTETAYITKMGEMYQSSKEDISYLVNIDSSVINELKAVYTTDDSDVISFDLSTAEGNAAAIKRIYYLNRLYNLVLTASDYIDTNVEYTNNIYSEYLTSDKSQGLDAVMSESDVAALSVISSTLRGIQNELPICESNLSSDEYNSICPADMQQRINDLSSKIGVLASAGIQENNLINFFVDNELDQFLFRDLNLIPNVEKVEMYASAVQKQSGINTFCDNARGAIDDKTLVDNVFSLQYYGQRRTLKEAFGVCIDVLKTSTVDALKNQLDEFENTVKQHGNITNFRVTINNYFIIKAACNNVDDELYNKLVELNLVDFGTKSRYSKYESIKFKLDDFAKNGGYDFDPILYSSVTRKATGAKATGAQGSAYITDLARQGDKDNFVADSARVNNAIDNLDSVIVSPTFASILSLKKIRRNRSDINR